MAQKCLVVPFYVDTYYLAEIQKSIHVQDTDEIKTVFVNKTDKNCELELIKQVTGLIAVKSICWADTISDTKKWKSGVDVYLALKDFLQQKGCFTDFERSFMNAALFDVISTLKNAETEFDYRDILTEIKYYIEDELHFLDKPTSYYYDIDWVKEYISLIHKKPVYSGEKNKLKITVVIPSLNSRPYIRECVESVLEQTLKEIEILCVDAGSADGTTEILQEYAKLDKRINIIHSDKQSYGYQINLGIKNAHGDYFAILEPDDYIVPEMYEELYKIAKDNEVEVLKADFEIFTGKNGERKFIYRKIANQDNQYNTILDPTVNFELFRNTKIPWSGLYDMGFIHQKSILLNESPGASFQDNGLWFQTFCQTHRLYYVNKSYYRLRGDNPNSPIYSKGKVFCICEEYDFIREFLRKNKVLEQKFAPLCAYYRYTNYNWRLERIAEEFKIDFLKRFAEDFIKIENNNELDASLFTKQQWTQIHNIIQNPEEYYYNESKISYEFVRILPPKRYPQILKRWFKNATGKELDLKQPKTFNEKIQWLKLYDNTELKTRLADKYLVREWIKEKIGEKYLIPLLGVWSGFDEIDFQKLPNQFVLKTNHGSGWNVIVRDKDTMDLEGSKSKFNLWLKKNYAACVGLELQYGDIKPRIIAEKYMAELDGGIFDYRFFCFNGEPKYVWVDVGSGTKEHKRSIFDLKWNLQDMRVNYPVITPTPSKPDNFDEMLSLAEKLCQGFIFVRIDFYSIRGKTFFGEMTFTPQSGIGKWYPEEQNLIYGNYMTLSLDHQSPLPNKSFAEKGTVPLPDSIVLPKTEIEMLKDAIKSKDGRVRTLLTEKSKLEADKSRLQAEKSKLEADKSRLQAEKSKLEADKSRLQAEKSKLEADKSRLQAEKSKFESDKNKLVADNNKLRDEIKKIKNSKAYKVGTFIAWPVRTLRKI